MFYTTLSQVINHITNTNMVFAGTPWKDEMTCIILNTAEKIIREPALVGITYEAVTDCSHGEMPVYITIEKVIIDPADKTISAGWEVTVSRREG